jgi:hypothetical protein
VLKLYGRPSGDEAIGEAAAKHAAMELILNGNPNLRSFQRIVRGSSLRSGCGAVNAYSKTFDVGNDEDSVGVLTGKIL